MTVTPAACYEAIRSRDARFDGRFFTAVLSTGVYCRPICPARTPKRENVRFYPCAAAAEAAGFRACRRCRPDTAPGTPAWLGTSATTSRALRLILDGALDGGSLEDLSARVGIGPRHLRRLFVAHLGAPPLVVAHTRRVHFARKLIDETTLPMTRVAHAAEFPSVRRFNAAIRQAYGRTPTALRREARDTRAVPADAALVLRLPFRPPYDWSGLLKFIARRATPGVEAVGPGTYERTIAVNGTRGSIEVTRPGWKNHLLLRVRVPDAAPLAVIVERVRRMFDLGADPREIQARLRSDRRLRAALAARPGIRVPGAWDAFELSVRAILGQQVSVRAATTLAGRLARAWGEPIGAPDGEDRLSRLFPTPEALAGADLPAIGLPPARARAVRDLAQAVAGGEIRLTTVADPDEVARTLTRIAGIGPWTAQYIAMRALGEPDAFPASDLGLRRALSSGRRLMSSTDLARHAERWRPWRAYAAMLLWMDEGRHHDVT